MWLRLTYFNQQTSKAGSPAAKQSPAKTRKLRSCWITNLTAVSLYCLLALTLQPPKKGIFRKANKDNKYLDIARIYKKMLDNKRLRIYRYETLELRTYILFQSFAASRISKTRLKSDTFIMEKVVWQTQKFI